MDVAPNFRQYGLCTSFKKILVANAFISPFNTQTMHIKSFYTQQHCYVSLKTLYPGGIRTPGLLVPKADAMSTAPRRQGDYAHH
jgi:hypothetical protein